MKITFFQNLSLNSAPKQKQAVLYSAPSDFSKLQCDKVSFKSSEIPTLYRGCCEDEINDVFTGGKGGTFGTTDYRGWRGKWFGDYFITFKSPEIFNKAWFNDRENKWIINKGYDLSYVDDICPGSSLRVSKVYSSNWSDDMKNQFVQNVIKKYIRNVKEGEKVNESLRSLSYYLKDCEFLDKDKNTKRPGVDEIVEYCTDKDGKFDIKPIEDYLKDFKIFG